jgi:hypothetical protein
MPSDLPPEVTVDDVAAELDALRQWNRQLWLFAWGPVLMVLAMECAP